MRQTPADESAAGMPAGWFPRAIPGGEMCTPQSLANAAGPGCFDPLLSGGEPVAEGGRQAAWFVDGPGGPAVLRHYRRGGLRARLGRESYFWLGRSRVRSYAEARVLSYLHGKEVLVPRALAAAWWRSGLFYRAAIIVERIPGARTLSGSLDTADPMAVGKAITGMHEAGVWHADLNAQNILLDDRQQVWLIDFDRARKYAVVPQARQRASLLRLRRSLIRLAGQRGADWWDTLDQAMRTDITQSG